MTPWALLAFTVLTAGALALLFPQRELVATITRSPAGDALTDAYLAILHALQPDDAHAALLLAKTRLAQGRVDEALALAAPHLRSRDLAVRSAALGLRIDVLRRRPGSGAALIAAAEASLREAASPQELLAFAQQPELAREDALLRAIYRRLAAHEDDPLALARAARRFIGHGDYRFAAELYFIARQRARDVKEERAYFLEGVRALEAGNLPREALSAAQKELGALGKDEPTLLEMVRLARGAGRPDVAAQYMKQLVWPRRQISSWPSFISAAHAADAFLGMHAYDARLFGLAYEVFLADQDLEAAYRVARAAVELDPDEPAWRERLAQVAEQSGRPVQALAAWRWLAERTDSAVAWQALLRLAPGLNDDEALALALRRQVELPGSSVADSRALAQAYERLGKPREGAQWFESRYRTLGDPAALEMAADLAERLGQTQRALALNLALVDKGMPSPERLVRIARLQILSGELEPAHALLQRFRGQTGPHERQYWELLGELAWSLQRDDSAIEALRILVDNDYAEPADYDRLVVLLRERAPADAARLAQLGFERHRRAGLLLQAIEILWDQRQLAQLGRLYAGLRRADEALFGSSAPYFYSLRSQYRRAKGDAPGARADLERAIAIAPEEPAPRITLLWLLVEMRSREALRAALLAASGAARDPAYWPAMAAGWMSLDEPRRALPFFSRLAQRAPDDFLWLASYAEALELDGQGAAAERARRHAWTLAQRAAAGGLASLSAQQRAHYGRLALRQAPADVTLHALREIWRLEQHAPRDGALDELLLTWLIANEQHEQAKAWMQARYSPGSAPAWAALAVAAVDEDAEAANRVLAQRAGGLTEAQRAEAARIAGEPLAAPAPGRAAATLSSARRGAVSSQPLELAGEVALGARGRLGLEWREARQHSVDESVLRSVPATDRELRLWGREPLGGGSLEAGVGAREAFADTTSGWLRYSQGWQRRLATVLSLSGNERTLDSSALAVAGVRNEISLRAQYALSHTELLGLRLWSARYRSQNGIALGAGAGYEVDAAHRLQLGYPDASLRLFAAQWRTRAQGAGDPATAALSPTGEASAQFFIPPDASRYGIGVSVGDSVRDGLSGAPRPYGGFDLIHSSSTGAGYQARLGVRGRAFGADQLSAYWLRGRSLGLANESVLEFGMRYEHYFDRF